MRLIFARPYQSSCWCSRRSRNLWLFLLLLVVVGGLNMTWQTTLNTLLQTSTPDGMWGRVMASYSITALEMMPLGQGPMGYAIDAMGPERALTLGAALSLVVIAYMAFVRVKHLIRLP